MKVRRALLRDTVTVETYSGDGAYGPSYAAAVTVRCNIDAKRRLVRSSAGDEVVSEATLQLHPDTRDLATGAILDPVALFAPESRVTVNGRPTGVIDTKAHTLRGKVAYVEVTVA